MALSFTWTGGGHGVWSDPSNWTDVTTTPMPATTAPGADDSVSLAGGVSSLRVVNGPGNAASLTLSDQLELSGTFNFGTLTQSGTLAFLSGSVIAGSASFGGWVDQIGGGMMAGSLSVDGGTLTVEAGAWMEVGSDGTADGSYGLLVDFNSSLMGTGASLDVGSVLNRGTIAGSFSSSTILTGTNAGLMSGVSVDGIVNTGTIMTGDGQSIAVGDLTGSGSIEVSQGGTLAITQGVSGTVAFLGDTGTLAIDGAGIGSDTLVVSGFTGGDIIRIGGMVTSASFTANGYGDGTLTATTDAGTFFIDIQGLYNDPPAALVQDGTLTVGLSLPCFAAGTRIMTRAGAVKVEALRPGDEVATLLPEGFRPLRWLGHRSLRVAGHPDPREVQPVRIRAGAFGPGLPERDLYLSPDHAIYAEGVLIPVKHLVDGNAVAQIDVESITYFHVELDRHDVLLAEGLPAESYLDTGDRACFANGGAVTTLYPKFGPLTWEAEGCAPLAVTGAAVKRLRAMLKARAGRAARRHRAA